MHRSLRRLSLGALLTAQLTAAAIADDIVLASLPVGECTLTVEARTREPHVLRVRAFHPRYAACHIDQGSLAAVLRAAWSGPPPATPVRYSSLFLGRLIDYPWLSAEIARTAARDTGWNARTGRPVRVGVNNFVAGLLSRPAVIDALQPALDEAGYRIAGASVEKVLVLPAREIPALDGERLDGRLPFDAMAWLHLEPR